MPPKPPYVCIHADCERLRVAGRKVCREHLYQRKERATYRCKLDGCDELHLSGGFCREHQEHAVQEEDAQPTIVFYQDGTPGGLAERLQWLARRMEIQGADLSALCRNIGGIVRWEEQNRHDES